MEKEKPHDLLSLEEKSKLVAETLKLDSERIKVELETKEIEKRLTASWFRSKSFAQGIVAGFVAIPLIWFYLTQVAVPLYQSDNVKLTLQNEETKRDLNEKKINFTKLQTELDSQRTVFLVEIDNLRVKNQTIQQSLETTVAKFKDLSKIGNEPISQKEQYKKTLDTLHRQIVEYAKFGLKLQSQISNVSNQAYQSYDSSNDKNQIRYDGLYERKDSSISYWEYIRFFNNGSVLTQSLSEKLDKIPSWFVVGDSNLSTGTFERIGPNISFTTKSKEGAVDFSGKVFQNVIVLDWRSHINGNKGQGSLYKFVSMNP